MTTAELLLLWTRVGIAAGHARMLPCSASTNPASAFATALHSITTVATAQLLRPSLTGPSSPADNATTAIFLQMGRLSTHFPRSAILHHPRHSGSSFPTTIAHSGLPIFRSSFASLCHRIHRSGQMSLGRLHNFPVPPSTSSASSLDVRFRLPLVVFFPQSQRIFSRYRSVSLFVPSTVAPAAASARTPSYLAGNGEERRSVGERFGNAVEAFVGGAFRRTGSGSSVPGTTPEATRYSD